MTQSCYPPEQAQGLWVYLEQEEGRLEGVSLELLGKGRELADAQKSRLIGILLGHKVGHLAKEAIAAGADEVLVADAPLLSMYKTDPYTRVVEGLVRERKPDIFLLGATPNGRDLAGRLAVRVRTGLTADCTNLMIDADDGLLIGEVVGFGGGILATIKCPKHRPQMFTVRPGIFVAPEPDDKRKGKVEDVAVAAGKDDDRVEVLEHERKRGKDLTSAEYLVVGGRGIRGDWSLIRELAELVKGEVGATRVPVDEGWCTRELQIGQTGFVTRPKVAFVFGVSGAIHFTVGIQDAGTVVAINTDPEAPIFEAADYCIVDDLFQILPPLVEGVRKAKASQGGA